MAVLLAHQPGPGEHAPGPSGVAPAAVPIVRRVYEVVRELLRGVATAYLATCFSLLFWGMAPIAAGWTPTVIVSGSMVPAINVGDVVYYAHADVATIAPGRMILVRMADGRLLSHRLHERRGDGTFITKGDANPSEDSTPVRPDQVLGVARLVVPHIGKIALWSPQQRGQAMLLIGLTVAALVLARDEKDRPE